MARLTITIDDDNDSFQPEPARELARILDTLASRIAHGHVPVGTTTRLLDGNGNTCGKLTYEVT